MNSAHSASKSRPSTSPAPQRRSWTGYRLKPRHTYLPYLELPDAPAPDRTYPGLIDSGSSRRTRRLDRATRALAEQRDTPFAAAAASARRKLAFDLPLSAEAVERILALPIPEHARQALAVLQDAVIDRTAVACQYFTMSRQVEAEREIEPWGLLFQWGRWYCVARAHDRDEPRLSASTACGTSAGCPLGAALRTA
jgi:hypothetical protein